MQQELKARMSEHSRVDLELLEVADRLVAEFPEVPTGSVLRCLSRAVHLSRALGRPPSALAHEAEDLARRMLRHRDPCEADDPPSGL